MLFHTSEESTKEFEKNVKIWFILLWKTWWKSSSKLQVPVPGILLIILTKSAWKKVYLPGILLFIILRRARRKFNVCLDVYFLFTKCVSFCHTGILRKKKFYELNQSASYTTIWTIENIAENTYKW
jgi:hypothetical protein